jgi:N-acetylglutamate synthase-like GNAT family acetyltransferase
MQASRLVDRFAAPVRLSPASSSDLPAVRALLERCALPAEDLQAGHLDHFVLCVAGDRLVGLVGLEPLGDVGLLRSLAVVPEERGRGFGHLLLERALRDARRLGIRRRYLLTTTAAALFARAGFRPLARHEAPAAIRNTTQYGGVCPGTAALMAIELSAETSG